MSFKKSLIAGSLMGIGSVSAVGCGSSVDTSLFEEPTGMDGGTDVSTDSFMDGETSVDGGKNEDAASEDSGLNCDQVVLSFNGPSSMAIEQGVLGVNLFCLEIKTNCHDQILNTLNFQTMGTLTAKDYSNSYSLRDNLDKPVGTYVNPSVTGEVRFNSLADSLVAGKSNQLCVFANISLSAPIATTIGLKVPKGGVILADSKTPIIPVTDVVGNLHTIVTKK